MAYNDLGFGSPDTQFFFDVNTNTFFKKDDRNYINSLGVAQLNTLGNSSLLDIFLSTGNVVEPHYHQNACELVYCISGAAVVSILNPFSKQILNFPIKPGQVANVPKAWWHYEIATADNTHLLAIFDAPTPEVILGSDILRLTPANIWAHTYCLDEKKVKETFAPIKESVFIGPPLHCSKRTDEEASQEAPAVQLQQQQQPNAVYQGQAPFDQRNPQGYPVPQGYAPPQGYMLPQGYVPAQAAYAVSQGYPAPPAAPQGYALAQGYPVPQGYPQQQAYQGPFQSNLNL